MTNEEKINAVTAKLTGTFYVGQAVRIDDLDYVGSHWQGNQGIVRAVINTRFGPRVSVDMGELSDGEVIIFEPRSVKPL